MINTKRTLAGLALAGLVAVVACGGRAPLAPSTPLGDSNGYTVTTYHYTTYPTDLDAGPVALRFTWDDGDTSDWTPTTHTYGVTALDSHRWSVSGVFHVRAQARDARDRLSLWSDSLAVTISSPGDEPPVTPDPPLGPDSGFVDSLYAFRSSTTDDDFDSLQYRFDWGNGDTSLWLGPLPAGETLTTHHAWPAPDTYDIRVQAKDVEGFGSTSPWSLPHTIIIH